MKQNKHWLVLVAALCLTCGCEDTTSGGTVSGQTAECDTARPCTGKKECVKGKCVEPQISDQDCAATQICPDNQKCVNDRCLPVVGLGNNCGDNIAVCENQAQCLNGRCRLSSGLGDACDSSDECGRFDCVNHTCAAHVHVGDYCDNGHVCDDSECINDYCVIYVDENENCEANKYLCKAGFACGSESQQCVKLSNLGEACDDSEMFCESPYECDWRINKCVTFSDLGDACNPEEFKTCDINKSLQCIDNRCVKPVHYNSECSETAKCVDADAICYEGHCMKTSHCESDSTCEADTYCCNIEGCEVRDVCVPYGTGPRPEVNEECKYETVKGLFEADIQCEWTGPDQDDPNELYKAHDNVLMTPLVMNTPHDSGTSNEIIFTTYNNTDGGEPSGRGSALEYYGVIRILNGETCELLESIFDDDNHIIAGSNLAMVDIEGDGKVEIFAARGSAQNSGDGGGLVCFHWDENQNKYVFKWKTTEHSTNTSKTLGWAGPSIHDINDDGVPEIIGWGGEVFSTIDGSRINSGQTIDELSRFPTVADLDQDSNVEIIGKNNIYRWNKTTNKWEMAYPNAHDARGYDNYGHGYHFGYADFGSFKKDENGADTEEFEYGKFDGKAEIVSCSWMIRVMVVAPARSAISTVTIFQRLLQLLDITTPFLIRSVLLRMTNVQLPDFCGKRRHRICRAVRPDPPCLTLMAMEQWRQYMQMNALRGFMMVKRGMCCFLPIVRVIHGMNIR